MRVCMTVIDRDDGVMMRMMGLRIGINSSDLRVNT